MPIYRGATRVTPKRGGQTLSRIYRGDSLVWSAELPRYTASSSGGGVPRLAQNVWTTITTHTVSSAGASSGIWGVQWRQVYNGNVDLRVLRNNAYLASARVTSPQTAPYSQSVNIPETAFSAGDLLTFEALYNAAGGASARYVDAWSWALS